MSIHQTNLLSVNHSVLIYNKYFNQIKQLFSELLSKLGVGGGAQFESFYGRID